MQPPFKPPDWLSFAQRTTMVSEAWQLGKDDAWREVLALLESLGIWTQPEENVDLTIIDYQWTFVELRICWAYHKAFLFALLSLPNDLTWLCVLAEERCADLLFRSLSHGFLWRLFSFVFFVVFVLVLSRACRALNFLLFRVLSRVSCYLVFFAAPVLGRVLN